VIIGWIGLLLALALVAEAVLGTARAQSAAEVAFWNRVRDCTSADELKAYLEAYPNGAFAEMARARLKQLAPISPRPHLPSAPDDALTETAVIREVQERLYNLNYEIGVLNGQMTQVTRNAIRQWQRNVEHEPRGDLTEEVLSHCATPAFPPLGARWPMRHGVPAQWSGTGPRARRLSAPRLPTATRAGRDACKVVTAADSGCGALGFYMGSVRRTPYWGAYAIVRPTLGQAMDLALSECREQAKKPKACGIRLTFCADGSHKQ